jgi:hypothetical protein
MAVQMTFKLNIFILWPIFSHIFRFLVTVYFSPMLHIHLLEFRMIKPIMCQILDNVL